MPEQEERLDESEAVKRLNLALSKQYRSALQADALERLGAAIEAAEAAG